MRIGGGRGDAGEHVLDQLSAYLDYELTDAERERVRAHLRRCPACENELATLKAAKQLLTEVPLHAVPRSFILTPDMVGHVMTGPVERRRSFGWSLAGRLRTATALVAVLLVLVLSGDVLTRLGGSGLAAVEAPTSSAAGAPPQARLVGNPTTGALAEATTTTAPSAAGGLDGATGPAEPPPAPEVAPTSAAAAAPTATTAAAPGQADTLLSQTTRATPAPPEDKYLYEVNPGTANTDQPDQTTGLYRTPYLAVTPPAPAPVLPLSLWQLAEGALLILVIVLGIGALWARGRGV